MPFKSCCVSAPRPRQHEDPSSHGFWNDPLSSPLEPHGRVPLFKWSLGPLMWCTEEELKPRNEAARATSYHSDGGGKHLNNFFGDPISPTLMQLGKMPKQQMPQSRSYLHTFWPHESCYLYT